MPSETKHKESAESEIKEKTRASVGRRGLGDAGRHSLQGPSEAETGKPIDTGSDSKKSLPADKRPERQSKPAEQTRSELGPKTPADNSPQMETDQKLEELSAQKFGTYLHGWYAHEGEIRFAGENGDEVYGEKPVLVTRPDGHETAGKIDLVVGDKHLFDFKTDDMRGWSESHAREKGKSYGTQMQQYMESPDTPDDCHGWIIATTPSQSDQVNKAFEQALGEYGVKLRFSSSVEAQAVLDEVESAVRAS